MERRRIIGRALAAPALAALIAIGCTGTSGVTLTESSEVPATEPAAEPTEAPAAEPTEAPAAEPTEAPAAEPTEAPGAEPTEAEPASDEVASSQDRVLGVFDPQNGIRRVYVLVPAGLTETEKIARLDDLRASADADPENADVVGVEHYLMDDESEFPTLLEELPRTEAGDSSRWPGEYVAEHTVGYTKLFFIADGEGGSERAYLFCRDLLEGCDSDNPPARWDA